MVSLTGERENIATRNKPVRMKRETVSLLGRFIAEAAEAPALRLRRFAELGVEAT